MKNPFIIQPVSGSFGKNIGMFRTREDAESVLESFETISEKFFKENIKQIKAINVKRDKDLIAIYNEYFNTEAFESIRNNLGGDNLALERDKLKRLLCDENIPEYENLPNIWDVYEDKLIFDSKTFWVYYNFIRDCFCERLSSKLGDNLRKVRKHLDKMTVKDVSIMPLFD